MAASNNIRAGRAYVEVTAETSRLQRNLTAAQAQLRDFGRACTGVGRDMLMLSAAMAAPMVLAAKSFAKFDDGMRLVQAVTQATEEQFQALTRTAQRLGRETSFTAQQAAEAMASLGRMGFRPEEIQSSIDAVLNLARATGTDLAEAGDIAANSMRIFGIEASQMGSVADVLTAAANGSAQTLTDLFEALKMAGPQASAAGESIQETSAAIAVLANMGIKGSLAGTALRKSFSQFAKAKVQEKLRGIGVETVEANGNLRKMADVMRDIAKAMAAMPTAEKLAFAEEIFDIRGSLAGLTLTANVDGLDAMLATLRNAEGVAAQTAKTMDAGLGGSFRLLQSAVEGAMNAIGEALSETLQPLVGRVTAVINVFTKWIEKHRSLITAFAAAAAGAATIAAALIGIGLAAKGAAAGIAAIQAVTGGFATVQTLLLAKCTAVKGIFSAIVQSFAEYRNAAIPALVGTERFCAALGLASTAANRTRASIILMSNAEAAAAVKTAIAAKWQAAAAALKNFRTATVAAAVATKGLTVAEAACAAGTAALNAARRAGAAALAAFTAASIKSAAATAAAAVGMTVLAAAAKIAAAAAAALSAAIAAIAAHPVLFAFIAIGTVLAGICMYLSRASRYTAQLSEEMGKLRERNDQLRKTDEVRMERLKQLADKQRLTNSEMEEAKRLAGALQQKYGDLGIEVLADRLNMAADAQNRFNEAMRKAALADLDAEMQELQANIDELMAENESLSSYWNNNLWSQISGGQEEAIAKQKANNEKILAYRRKIYALRTRKRAAEGSQPGAATGESEHSEEEQTRQNIDEENRRREAAAADADAAEKRVAEIDRQLARERRNELENEIDDVISLRDEYKRLIQTMLDCEKSKADDKQDKQRIAELEKKLAEADRTADERIAAAREKAARKMREDVAGFEERMNESAADIQNRRAEAAQDRKIDETMKSDPAEGMKMLESLVAKYQAAAEAAKASFEEELRNAQNDGKIDDEERKKLDSLHGAFVSAESMVDKYSDRLLNAQNSTSGVADAYSGSGTSTVGSWSLDQLDQLLGGDSAQERTAEATEEVARNTRETNKALKRLRNNGGTLAYA